MARRFFEDLSEAEELYCEPIPVTKQAIIEFAQRFDPQPFHTDESAAKESVFAGLVASSLHILALCTRAVVDAQGEIAILSGVGIDEVQMFNPVRPGDVLRVQARWTGLKRSKSKPDRGFARIGCAVYNQRGEPVVKYGYQYLIYCRSG